MSFRSLTPPKFVGALKDRDKALELEERLTEFVTWLNENGVSLFVPAEGELASSTYVHELIEEYVNG